jgi:hypothetical protein
VQTKKGIDPNHPHNIYYAENLKKNYLSLLREQKEAKAEKRKKTKKLNGKSKTKKSKAKKSTAVKANTADKQKKVDRGGSSKEINLDDMKERVSYGAVTQANVNALKAMEQIEQIRLKTQKERQQLVERELIKRVFSKIYTIEVNELRIIGDTLAPEIASYFNSDDSEAILKTNQRIESEVYKALNHIKRLIADYLKSVGSFFEDETETDEDFLN